MVCAWLRSEVFDHGFLHLPVRTAGGEAAFDALLRMAAELQTRCGKDGVVQPNIWHTVASDHLGWSRREASLVLQVFRSFSVASQLRRFVVFLVVQLYTPPLRRGAESSHGDMTVWPQPNELDHAHAAVGVGAAIPGSTTGALSLIPAAHEYPQGPVDPHLASLQGRCVEEAYRLQYIKQNVHTIIRALSLADLDAPAGGGMLAPRDAKLSRGAVDALGFLVAGSHASLRSRVQVSSLAELIIDTPGQDEGLASRASISGAELCRWLEEHLTVNEVVNPQCQLPSPRGGAGKAGIPTQHSYAEPVADVAGTAPTSELASHPPLLLHGGSRVTIVADEIATNARASAAPKPSAATGEIKEGEEAKHNVGDGDGLGEAESPDNCENRSATAAATVSSPWATPRELGVTDSAVRNCVMEERIVVSGVRGGAAVYVLRPCRFALLVGCSDTTVVLGAVATVLTVEGCDKLTVVAAAHSVRLVNCLDAVLQVYTPTAPLLLGDCRGIKLAPLGSTYPAHRLHLERAQVFFCSFFAAISGALSILADHATYFATSLAENYSTPHISPTTF